MRHLRFDPTQGTSSWGQRPTALRSGPRQRVSILLFKVPKTCEGQSDGDKTESLCAVVWSTCKQAVHRVTLNMNSHRVIQYFRLQTLQTIQNSKHIHEQTAALKVSKAFTHFPLSPEPIAMHILDWRRLCPNATMLCQCHSSPHSHSRQAAALTGRQAPQASDHMHLLLLWDLSQTQSQSPSARASWNCHTISKTIKTKRNQVGFETIFPRPESWPFQESSEHSAAPYSSTSGRYSFFNANAPSPKQLTSSPLFLSCEVFPPRSNFRLVGPPQRLLHMLLPGAGFQIKVQAKHQRINSHLNLPLQVLDTEGSSLKAS